MSNYSENHKVNSIVLAVINDGDGSMCGLNYKARCEAASRLGFGLYQFQEACRSFDRYSTRNFETEKASSAEIMQAAEILQSYYKEHVKELDGVNS